jgi:hypothetical protein
MSTSDTNIQVTVQDVVELHVLTIDEVSQVVVEDTDTVVVTIGQQGPPGPVGPVGAATQTLALEAGENLVLGDPVYVSANKLYIADNVTNFRVIGLVQTGATAGFIATVVITGGIDIGGLVVGSPYFLGSGIITNVVPSSSYVIRLGLSISSTTLLLNIEEPILLS